ncbi:membrane protein [Streptomyces sp. NRRL WC-3626]|uniref:SCO2584 family spore wall biosynthesis protein n=1 Tax=Streptomyces sp. NRRL WC-3626 TaxID=1463926 RepID=UPI0004BFE5AC|nr:membrane protein [Streptomyces sp. NRRL WC-3626]
MTPQVYSGRVPEDVGGTPFPDGGEPDDDHDRGVSDEEFASVVFDEAFVQAAEAHEPTAVERLLAAAQARAEASEAEAHRARARGERYDDGYGGHRGGYDDRDDDPDALEDGYGFPGSYGRQVRWHRPVAWMLAVVMGVGMVALAFSAVYRGGSSSRQDPAPPPATTGVEQGGAPTPSAPAGHSRQTVPSIPPGSP